MTDDQIEIRRARTLADYQACQKAQRRAWGITEDGYIVPVATMVGAQLHGGLVLGAFRPDGEAVGLSFAFLGQIDGRLGLYSQLTGVVPEYQGHGLGDRLKHAQHAYAAAQGLELIAWAFDPLQARNAYFNLEKLKATAGRYIENMYGPRSDTLNPGVPTDRLIVEWETRSVSRPEIAPAEALRAPRLLERGSDDLPRFVSLPVPTPDAPGLLLEVPTDIARLRAQQPESAEAWRQAVRDAFQAAFADHYRAVGFVRDLSSHPHRCYYRLERSP